MHCDGQGLDLIHQDPDLKGQNPILKILALEDQISTLKAQKTLGVAQMVSSFGGENTQTKKKKTISRDYPGNGRGSKLFMCCLSLGEKWKHINKFHRKFLKMPG